MIPSLALGASALKTVRIGGPELAIEPAATPDDTSPEVDRQGSVESRLRGPAEAESLVSQVRMAGRSEAVADDASTETGLQRPAEAGLRGPAAESLVSQVRMVGRFVGRSEAVA
ncbi:hypothetical protein ACFL5O_05035, partial [Myxococcota bacterium]